MSNCKKDIQNTETMIKMIGEEAERIKSHSDVAGVPLNGFEGGS